MKLFLLRFLAIAAFVQSFARGEPIVTNINVCIDEMLMDAERWIQEGGLDPLPLPDVEDRFEHKPMLITYTGDLYLTNGHMSDIKHASRVGDTFATYNRQLLRIQIGAALNNMKFRYDYQSIVMELGGWIGWVLGDIENMKMSADFMVDTTDNFTYMQNFKIDSIGYLDIKLRGNVLTDWLGNITINIVKTLFRTTITEYVSDKFKAFLQTSIDEMNEQRFNNAVAGTPKFIQCARHNV